MYIFIERAVSSQSVNIGRDSHLVRLFHELERIVLRKVDIPLGEIRKSVTACYTQIEPFRPHPTTVKCTLKAIDLDK